MPRQVVPTPELFDRPGYSHVVRAGDLLVIAGQVAVDEHGALVGAGDPQAQVRQVFENLRRALASAGAGFEDVVKTTVFATDYSVRPAVQEVRAALVSEPRPASTFLLVAGLTDPGYLVEIEALAYKPR